MTSLHFLARFILNEVNYVIVPDQYEIFLRRRVGGGGGEGGFEAARPFWSLVSTLFWKIYVRNITQSGQQALVFLPIEV